MPFTNRFTRTRAALQATFIGCAVMGLVMTASAFVRAPKPKISVSVMDLTTGQALSSGQIVTAGDVFQVTVTSNGGDCAGQLVVTALGTPGLPPAVLVQVTPFIVGPAAGGNSAVGGVLTANALGTATNDWKISASCNGAGSGQFDFDHFEFFAL